MAADGGGDKGGVDARGCEVIDVGVDDEVGAGGVEGGPVVVAEEGVLEHDWDALVDFGDLGQDTVDVGVDPGGGVGTQTGRGGEPG